MRYNSIHNTDLNVSAVALGTWVFAGDVWGDSLEKDSIAAVHAALDGGINFIDTAPIYGRGVSERIVGKAIKGRRDKVVLATKCGLVHKGNKIVCDLSRQSLIQEIDESLSRLQTEFVDLYQCHWPDPQTPIEETLDAMGTLKKQGKIKYIGVSNFDLDLLKRAVGLADIVTLQSQYSLLERTLEKDLLPFCREHQIGILSYGSLGGGILSGKYQTSPQFKKGDARSFFYKYYQGPAFEKCQELVRILKELGRPVSQAAINWTRQQNGVVSVIVGARNARQAAENLSAGEWDLTAEQMDRINRFQF